MMMLSLMTMVLPKPVQIQQQGIVMQSLKPDLQDHSHVYSSLNDDDDKNGDNDGDDDHDDHHRNLFHELRLFI